MARLTRSRLWAELTTTDFDGGALKDGVAVLPVAAIEQHGPHLPLATDAIINQGVIAAALALLPPDFPAFMLPVQAVGTSREHQSFPGTLSLSPKTLIRSWTEIGEGVQRAGLRKLIIFNSHGGQNGLLEAVAVDLRARLGIVVAWAGPSAFGVPDGAIPADEAAYGLHGGLKETSIMLHLRPDLVRMDKAAHFKSKGEAIARDFTRLRTHGRVGFGWMAEDLNPAGVVGDAASATAALGATLVAHAARGLADLILDLSRLELPIP